MVKQNKFFNLIIIFLTLSLSSCASLNVKPIDTHGTFIRDSDEERIWKRCAEEQDIIARSGWVYNDAKLSVYLNDLTKNIISDNVGKTSVSVKVIVVKNHIINAMMYPNGVMYVHTGLLANIENEAQLVSILGHEVTHFIERHTLKQIRNRINKSAFFATLSMVLTSASGLTTSPTDFSSLAMYNLISSINAYSREQEREADKGGFNALLRNNYSLTESVKVMEIFERDDKDDKNRKRVPYEYLDHPSNKARIKFLKSLCKLHEDESNDKNRLLREDIYRKNVNSLILDNASLDIKASRFNSAKRTIEKYLRLAPNDARAYYYLGEVFSNRNEKGDKEKAIENYKKSIVLDKNLPFPHRDLGLIYYKDKFSGEAKKEFEQYLALAPNADDKKYIVIYLDELGKGDKK